MMNWKIGLGTLLVGSGPRPGGGSAMGDVTGETMFTHTARDAAALLYRIPLKGDANATWEGE